MPLDAEDNFAMDDKPGWGDVQEDVV